MSVNLHELANTPGAVKAQQALKDAGLWKLTEEDKAELPRWDVTVLLTVSVEETVSVAASTEEEARRLARRFDDWNADGIVEDVSIRSVVLDRQPIGDPDIAEGDE